MDWLFLVAIGLFFIAVEMLTYTFFFVFFGAAFVAVGFLARFVQFDWRWQILLAIVLSLVLLIFLKKPIKAHLSKKEEVKDNFLDEIGVGIVKFGMIEFKGTFWKHDDMSGLEDGDFVKIDGVKDNRLIVGAKLSKE